MEKRQLVEALKIALDTLNQIPNQSLKGKFKNSYAVASALGTIINVAEQDREDIKPQILIDVNGGVVQRVLSNTSGIVVQLADWDNIGQGEDLDFDGIGPYFVQVMSDEEFTTELKEMNDEATRVINENIKCKE